MSTANIIHELNGTVEWLEELSSAFNEAGIGEPDHDAGGVKALARDRDAFEKQVEELEAKVEELEAELEDKETP